MAVTKVDFTREGPWHSLWPKTPGLMSHLEHVTVEPPWTFGGTVLMPCSASITGSARTSTSSRPIPNTWGP